MMDWLRTLYFEQTTPDEVIIFLLIWTGVALAAGFVLYAGVIYLLTALRPAAERVSPARLLFPSRDRLKAYAVDYTVAGSTALLLFLSVTARHGLVRTVLDQPVDQVMTAADVRRVLPLGAPTEAELRAAGASDEAARRAVAALSGSAGGDDEGPGEGLGGEGPGGSGEAAGVGELARMPLEPVVRSLLEAGLPENAGVLLRLAVRSAEDRLELTFPTREHLLVAAVLLLLGYAVWFGWDRSRRGKDARFRDAEHGEVIRRLGVPALCIPLLLVSAAAMDDLERRVARSAEAVASVGSGDALEEEGMGWLTTFAEARIDSLAVQIPPNQVAGRLSRIDALLTDRAEALGALEDALDGLDARFAELEARAGGLEGRFVGDSAASEADRRSLEETLGALGDRISTVGGELGALDERIADATSAVDDLEALTRQELAGLNGELDELSGTLDDLAARLPDTGLVFVVTPVESAYQVRPGSPQNDPVAQGTDFGLHQLPPGNYAITGNGAVQTGTVALAAGEAVTVRLDPVIIQ